MILNAPVGWPVTMQAKFAPKTEAGTKLVEKGYELERTGFPGYRAVTIKKDGEVIGEILSSRSHEDANTVVIGGVDVKRAFRRQGIAEAMYRELLTDLQEDGVQNVTGYLASAGPIRVREKLLPGTKYESAGTTLTVEEAMQATPEVARALGLPTDVGLKATSPLPAGAKFAPSKFVKPPSEATVKDLAEASPAVKDASGALKPFYHGSHYAKGIEDAGGFLMDKLNPSSLFGPLIYFTDLESAAAGQPIRNRIRKVFGSELQGYATKPTAQGSFFGMDLDPAVADKVPVSPGVVAASDGQSTRMDHILR
jgi:predicted GNAT family acetyltransferase